MLNQDLSIPIPRPSFEPDAICAGPGCSNVVTESWDDLGRLCGRCAIEDDLFDRESRWSRVFPVERVERVERIERIERS